MNRCRESAGTQKHRQVFRLLLGDSATRDRSLVADRVVNRCYLINLVIQNNAQRLAFVRSGEIGKMVARRSRQVENNLRLIGVLVACGLSVTDIRASYFGGALDLIELIAAALGCSTRSRMQQQRVERNGPAQ